MTALHRRYLRQDARLSFSAEELGLSYPVNPLVLDCLEALAGNYLSSTRSLIGMIQKGLLEGDFLSEDADRLLTLDRIFDLEGREVLSLPETEKFRQAWEFFSRNLPSLIEADDLGKAEVIAKSLALIGLAGFRWPVKLVAEALIGCKERELWGNWMEVERLLKRLWRKGAYLEAVRSAEPGGNEYFLEVSTDISEAVRRRMNEALAALSAGDERVSTWALQSCDGEPLPLAHFCAPRAVGVEGMGVRRYVNIGCRRLSTLKEGELAEAAALLESPSCREDGWLFISMPGLGPEKEKLAWRENAGQVKGRFGAGILAWLPRAPKENEWEILREYAALNLLLADATLSSSRKGREIRSRLKDRLAFTREECRRAVGRGYMEGEVLGIEEQVSISPASLGAEKWEEMLGDLFSGRFRLLFPSFASIAPRQRLAGRAHTNQIIERFLRSGQAVLSPGSALEEHLANLVEPLGFLRREGGRFQLAVSPSPLVEQVLSFLPEPAKEPRPESAISYAELEGRLRKGKFGLTPEMAELVIAALVRAGYLRGLDGFLLPLHLSQVAAPLSDNLPFLMRASPLSEKEQMWLVALGKRLFGQEAGRLDLGAQEALWDHLRGWRRRALADLPEVSQGLENFICALGQEGILWSASRALLQQIPRLLEREISGLASSPGLGLFLQAAEKAVGGPAAALDALERFARLRQFLRQHLPSLQQAYLYLTDSRLILPEGTPLAKPRAAILEGLAAGEEMIPRAAALTKTWERLRHAYLVRYQAWHNHQHSLARFRPYLSLQQSEAFRFGERLACAKADEGGDFASLEGELRKALSLHCAGPALPAALQASPVCPECGLRLGEKLALPDAKEMEMRLNAINAKMQKQLLCEERVNLLRRRLEAEAPGELRRRLEGFLSSSAMLTREEVTSLLSPEVAEWMGRQLGLRISARRRIGELTGLLVRRELTRAEALRLFLGWLDEENRLGEKDLVAIE